MTFQDINFLNALPKPPKVYPSFYQMFCLWVALGAGLFFYHLHERKDLTSLQAKIGLAKQLEKKLLKDLSNLEASKGKEGGALIAIAKNTFVEQEESFYEPLSDLSKRLHTKLWLNHIEINRSNQRLLFNGHALEPGAVYDFIEELKVMPSFKGSYFNLFALDEIDFIESWQVAEQQNLSSSYPQNQWLMLFYRHPLLSYSAQAPA